MTGRLGGVGGGEADRHWQSITIRRARIFEEFLCKNTWVGAYFVICYDGLYSGAAVVTR
jgi:hypothetical protein